MADFGYNYPTGYRPGPPRTGRKGKGPAAMTPAQERNGAGWALLNQQLQARQAAILQRNVQEAAAGLNPNVQDPTPPAPLSPSGGGGGGGFGGGAPAAPAFDPTANINQQFDAQKQLLLKLLAGAHTDISNTGSDTQKKLRALAADASKQSAGVGADIKALYAKQLAQSGGDVAALAADLQRQGADTGALADQAKVQDQALRSQGARQQSLQARLAQVLGADLADRQAGVGAVTSGVNQQLTSKGAMLQQQLEQQRMQALAALAAQQAAAASGGGGGGRGGRGGGGGGSSKTIPMGVLSAVDYASLINNLGLSHGQHKDANGNYVPDTNPAEFATLSQIAANLGLLGHSVGQEIAHWNQWTAQHPNTGTYNPNDIFNYLNLVKSAEQQNQKQRLAYLTANGFL